MSELLTLYDWVIKLLMMYPGKMTNNIFDSTHYYLRT